VTYTHLFLFRQNRKRLSDLTDQTLWTSVATKGGGKVFSFMEVYYKYHKAVLVT